MKDFCVASCVLLLAFYICQTSASFVVFKTKDCGSQGAKVENVTMYPAIAKRGETIAFKSTLTTDHQINGGKFTVKILVHLFGRDWTIFQDGDDLCNMIRGGTCPIKAHKETVMTYRLYIGRLVRYGDFHCKITYTDEKGKTFVCFTLEFPFHAPPSDTTPRVKSVV